MLPGFAAQRIEVVNTLEARFQHALLDVLLLDPALQDELLIVDLADNERAIVWKDDRLAYLLGAGRHALWLASGKLRVERFSTSEFRFEHARLAVISSTADATKFLDGVQVNSGEEVLLFRDGILIGRLSEGLHVFWKGTGKVAWKAVDRRETTLDVAGQEIMTPTRLRFALNLIVTYQVTDRCGR